MRCKINFILDKNHSTYDVVGRNEMECLEKAFAYLEDIGVSDAEIEVIEDDKTEI